MHFDAGLGVWVTSDGAHWPNQADADRHEAMLLDQEFASSFGAPLGWKPPASAESPAPARRRTLGVRHSFAGVPELDAPSEAELEERRYVLAQPAENSGPYSATRRASNSHASDLNTRMVADPAIGGASDSFWDSLIPNAAATVGGLFNPFLGAAMAATNEQALYAPNRDANAESAAVRETNAANVPSATSPVPKGTGTGTGEGEAGENAEQAEEDYRENEAENEAENDQAWSKAWNAIEGVDAPDNALGDEAREWQREGLAQQRMLLEKMLGFDPNAYADQYADQTLARQVALGRSQGGGYGAQQAGMFAAMEQAPALYAEGQRQASALENERLRLAQSSAKSFGELGTMTRGQDENRSQFESNLQLSIADSVASLTQGQVELNQRETEAFAEIWMNFSQLQSVYDKMSHDEQLAWWDDQTKRYGIDKQFEAVKAQLRAQGKVTSKDMMGGIFQLGGAAITAYGTYSAAGNQGGSATSGAAT